MTVFDARTLARGWLSVAIACSKDDGRPALNRTVSIEAFSEGLRLTATDSYVLLTTWVPNIEHDLDPAPALDEAPYATAVAMDPHGRAKGFLAHVLRLAGKDDDAPPIEVRVNLGVVDEVVDEDRPSFAGMEVRYVVLDLHDQERLKLATYEGVYPSWRAALAGFAPEPTERIALNPEIVGRLAKLGTVQPGAFLRFAWGGETGAARVDTVHGWPDVDGLVMPVRWDFDRNEPRIDEEHTADLVDHTDPEPAAVAWLDGEEIDRARSGISSTGWTLLEALAVTGPSTLAHAPRGRFVVGVLSRTVNGSTLRVLERALYVNVDVGDEPAVVLTTDGRAALAEREVRA